MTWFLQGSSRGRVAKFNRLLYINVWLVTLITQEAANLPQQFTGAESNNLRATRDDKPSSVNSNPYGFPRIRDKWLGKWDPSSFSNPEDIVTESMHINWKVDFTSKRIYGYVVYNLKVNNPGASRLVFDTLDLDIHSVTSGHGKELKYEIGQNVSGFGEPFIIQVGDLVKQSRPGNNFTIEVHYSTTESSAALHWLDPVHTVGKKFPYLFSLCQSINARSLLPCQDTPTVKAPFTAKVKISKDFQVLMGAALIGECVPEGEFKIYKFEQKLPIPSYLIAIAAGAIVGKELGPRSRVWTEKEVLNFAASELADVEQMIAIGEQLFGKYVWGHYDVLVLPPSFAYEGMEHPSITFATPSILTGDKSLVYVIAHEIAHSWTGNLVTNKNWEHFWLNEGLTQFAERKILGVMHGEPFRHLASLAGLKELKEEYDGWGIDHSATRLIPDLNGVRPDAFYSLFPYEKGCSFLFYLEQKVGGAGSFDPFLREYIQNNSFKSIDTDDFKTAFINFFNASDKIADVKWDDWLYTTGLSPEVVEYDMTLYKPCIDLKKRWVEWDPNAPPPFHGSDLNKFIPDQIIQFLQELMEVGTLPTEKVRAIDQAYQMTKKSHPEMRFRWIRISLRAKYTTILPTAFEFANEHGSLRYVRLVYRELFKWAEVREMAIENFKKHSSKLQRITSNIVRWDLETFYQIHV